MSKPPVLQRHWRTICQQRQQRGTTMIEVMVAALVLSAGLLGLAAMQTRAIQTASGLATQQVMVQTLGAYNEARLSTPNTSISGGQGRNGEYYFVNGDLAYRCAGFSLGLSISNSQSRVINPNISDFNFFNNFLATYTSCGGTALTDYAEYANRLGANLNTQAGEECDYIVPETHLITCTLATGDVVSMENLVWLR